MIMFEALALGVVVSMALAALIFFIFTIVGGRHRGDWDE